MRRIFLVLLALVLTATACSSDSSRAAAAVEAASVEAEPEVVESPAADDETTSDGEAEEPAAVQATETPAPAATPVPFDPETCSYQADLTADRIEVAQIPGDGRDEAVLSALRDPANIAFPTPLVDLNRILSGGPPPDGIPPIDAPVFQSAHTVDWIQCNEPVLSLRVGEETRAYPVQILTWHELVNDTFGDVPVAVSYCPLCNSALAYRRDVGDRVVTFGTSGSLFNSSLVMYDRETESLWTHFNGSAVVGELTGTELELLPMQTTSWANFLKANPEGLVLTRETGHDRAYGRNPYSGYDDVTTTPFLLDQDADPRLPAKQRVVAIRANDDSAAVVLDDLAEAGVLVTELGGQELSVWHLEGTATALETGSIADGRDVGATGVYVPVVDGQSLTFSSGDDDLFVDVETSSTWNIQGLATSGPLEGAQLEPIEHLDTFWFAIAAFEPDTRVVTASA